jgi:hypothetical protein
MTKKHFIALADAIREHNAVKYTAEGLMPKFDEHHLQTLTDFLDQQNPRFNRERWLGYINGTNGKNGGAIKH